MDLLLCPWESATYLLFSSNVPNLMHYSHFTAIIAALFVGIFVFLKNRETLSSLLLLLLSLFSFWAILDVIIWASNRTDIIMFLWSIIILIEPLIYVTAFYIFHTFAYKHLPNLRVNLIVAILLLPLILLISTSYNLQGLDIKNCVATEGPLALYYTYVLEVLFIIGILFILFTSFFKLKERTEKFKLLYFALGLMVFLVAFSSGNIIGSITGNWEVAQYGLFGMPIFIGFLAYLVVQYRLFNIKVIATQALVLGLWLLIGSLLFVVKTDLSRIVAFGTLVFAVFFGFMLVNSVKREVELREKVEQLATNLAVANEKLKELDLLKSQFLSMASHDLRTPLTIIRNFVSLLLDGSYGKLSPSGLEGLQQVFERATDMAKSVETYLDVSRIEQGKMKYDFIDVEILPLIKNSVAAFTPFAVNKGLLLTVTFDQSLEGTKATLDVTKTNEMLNNLLDNTIKYTPRGTIRVSVKRVGKMAETRIQDTGVGMSAETLKNLFGLFKPGEDSKRINPASTGVGLYITKKHAEAQGGKVWAESEGVGKGSTFILHVPLI